MTRLFKFAIIRPQSAFTQTYKGWWMSDTENCSFTLTRAILAKLKIFKVNIMKKTLVALAVTAFAASASAVTVYDNEGTKIDFEGSLRLLLENDGSKTKKAGVETTTKRSHTNLKNDGSRFAVRAKHDLAEDFFAFGRLELRFNGEAANADQFGDLYAHRAYVGLGSKQYGEVSFGRQVTIGDDIAQSGFDNTYGVWDTTLTISGKSVIRYDYKGIEGLQIGVDYRFAEDRATVQSIAAAEDAVTKAELALLKAQYNGDATADEIAGLEKAVTKAEDHANSLSEGEVISGKLKSGYGAGVIYNFPVAEGQSMTLSAGYTRDNYVTTKAKSHHRDAYAAGVAYNINALTLAADYFGSFEKQGSAKERTNGFRVGAKYAVTPAVDVYGNYAHGVVKGKAGSATTSKETINAFMLGTSYQLHKNVFTFIEGRIEKFKTTDYTVNPNDVSKDTNKAIGVGLRVFW